MKIVSFIKQLIQHHNPPKKELEFFIYRICISLVNCKEYTIDSFSGRVLGDIDFTECDINAKHLFPWQRNIIHLERILALWSWERKERFSKHVEAGTALLRTFARKTHSTNTQGYERASVFQSSYMKTPKKIRNRTADNNTPEGQSNVVTDMVSPDRSPLRIVPQEPQQSSLRRMGESELKATDFGPTKTPSLGKQMNNIGSFGTLPFNSEVGKQFGIGQLLLMSQTKDVKVNPNVREAQLRPEIFSKFNSMDKESQRMILSKMKNVMNEQFKQDLRQIRSPMLKKKYQLLESGIKLRQSGMNENLLKSELVTRAGTKERPEVLPTVMETNRKNNRRQSLLDGNGFVNIEDGGAVDDCDLNETGIDGMNVVEKNVVVEKARIRTFDDM